MKHINQVEIVLFARHSSGTFSRKELVRWLGLNLQSAIRQQQDIAKKLFVETLKDSPAIYLS